MSIDSRDQLIKLLTTTCDGFYNSDDRVEEVLNVLSDANLKIVYKNNERNCRSVINQLMEDYLARVEWHPSTNEMHINAAKKCLQGFVAFLEKNLDEELQHVNPFALRD